MNNILSKRPGDQIYWYKVDDLEYHTGTVVDVEHQYDEFDTRPPVLVFKDNLLGAEYRINIYRDGVSAENYPITVFTRRQDVRKHLIHFLQWSYQESVDVRGRTDDFDFEQLMLTTALDKVYNDTRFGDIKRGDFLYYPNGSKIGTVRVDNVRVEPLVTEDGQRPVMMITVESGDRKETLMISSESVNDQVTTHGGVTYCILSKDAVKMLR